MSWEDAKAFCQWLTEKERSKGLLGENQSYRLPMDAEWSTAVGLPAEQGNTPGEKINKIRGVYPWGTQWPPPVGAGNYAPSLSIDTYAKTSPVGSFAANRFGLFDMGGNVWQWCEDWLDSNQRKRVLRGASWNFGEPSVLLSSCRNGDRAPDDRRSDCGFRLVLAVDGKRLAIEQKADVESTIDVNLEKSTTLPISAKAPRADRPWTNSLGMRFVPVPGTTILFSIWDTRVQDYQVFVSDTQREWPKANFAQGPTHPAVNVSWEDAKAFCQWLTEKERRVGLLRQNQSYSLPTDAEWSTAVGLPNEEGDRPAQKNGKIKDAYPWGTQYPPPYGAGNYNPSLNVDAYQHSSPVGSFAPNRYGLLDMGGMSFNGVKTGLTINRNAVSGAGRPGTS